MRVRAPFVLVALAMLAIIAASGYIFVPSPLTTRVVDAAGRPVPGATVTIFTPGWSQAVRAVTEPNGFIQLAAGVKLPGQRMTVSAPGFLEGQGPVGRAMILHRRPRLFGRFTDETGTGIDHAVVTVAQGRSEWQTVTDAGGFYWLEGVLSPGHAFVAATADGHDAFRGEIDLEADHFFQVNGAMSRQIGTLVITTDPAGAVPMLDGAPIESCPATPCSPSVAAGLHTLSIDSSLYVPWSTVVSVWEGSQLVVPVTLERKTGTLQVNAPAGDGAVLLIDGQRVGAQTWSGLLTTGQHIIAYSADDHWPALVTADVAWNQTTTVAVSSAPVRPGDEAGFQAGMAQYLSSLPGQFSAWVTPLAGGAELGYQPSVVMEAASVIKLPLAIFIEKSAQDGTIKMNDQVELEDGDFMGGTGTLNGSAHSGDKYSYHDLLGLLVQQSDNTAWQALDRALGGDKVDAYSATAGAADCHQGDDGCSAREAGLLIQKLAAGQLLDQSHTSDLLQLLETTAFNDRINYYLGGYTVAHKVGMDGSVINDSGVVYGSRPFVVSMFTVADPAVGVEAIRQVSRLAARLYG
jgi:beta-lactamase class A